MQYDGDIVELAKNFAESMKDVLSIGPERRNRLAVDLVTVLREDKKLKILRMKAAYVDRLPFCSDHRDKLQVLDTNCLMCDRESQTRKIVNLELANRLMKDTLDSLADALGVDKIKASGDELLSVVQNQQKALRQTIVEIKEHNSEYQHRTPDSKIQEWEQLLK